MNPATLIPLLDLGLSILETFLGKMQNNLPAEIVADFQAVIDKLAAHKADLLTKVNAEAQRG
jgi:hypothetical protein